MATVKQRISPVKAKRLVSKVEEDDEDEDEDEVVAAPKKKKIAVITLRY